MHVLPYLFFDGRCEEALEFYRQALGAEVTMLLRFKDNPQPETCSGPMAGEKIMHASFRIGNTMLQGSDGHNLGKPVFQGFALSLTAPDAAAANRLFEALGDGGQIQLPLMETFFSPRFGMVADRFGVTWMIIVEPPVAQP